MIKARLRAVEPADVDFIMECESDPMSSRWTDYRAPLSREQLLTYALTYDADPFRAGQLRLVAETAGEREDYRPAGIVDLYEISEKDSRAYTGICIHPDLRRNGLGLGSLEALALYNASRLGLDRLIAKISTENLPALRLYEKAGYRKVAMLPSWHRIGSRFHDFHLLIQKNPSEV